MWPSLVAGIGLAAREALVPVGEVLSPEDIHHHFSGQPDGKGVYAKEMRIAAGKLIVTHAHPYDHMSILACGAVLLTVDGISSELRGPAVVPIAKGKMHGIRGITDAVWFCIHSNVETDPAKIDAAILEG